MSLICVWVVTHIRVVLGGNSWKNFEERYVTKYDLSKNRDFKMNWSGLEVFMECWVDLGINTWKKKGENTHYGQFSVTCTGTP